MYVLHLKIHNNVGTTPQNPPNVCTTPQNTLFVNNYKVPEVD